MVNLSKLKHKTKVFLESYGIDYIQKFKVSIRQYHISVGVRTDCQTYVYRNVFIYFGKTVYQWRIWKGERW